MSSEDPTATNSVAPAETLDELQARHRKEQRDLQSRITQKKKNASKKTRKGVNDECATLEREMKERQAEEVALLSGESGGGGGVREDEEKEEAKGEFVGVNGAAQNLENSTISPPPPATASQSQSQPEPEQAPIASSSPSAAAAISNSKNDEGGGAGKKRNRQKERLARRAAEVEAASAAAESEAAGMTDHRALERSYMDAQFRTHGLVEQDIQPDGHCLFSAVADQLRTRGYDTTTTSSSLALPISSKHPEQGETEQIPQDKEAEPGYKTTRRAATEYMASHRDDFEPFLAMDERSGGTEGWDGYITKMRDTATWGGQLELTALANVYGVEIRVVQDGRTESITPTTTTTSSTGGQGDGEGSEKRTIWLAYYRHGYGLGEHYNSLRPKS